MVRCLLVLPLFKKYIFHFVLHYYLNQFKFKIYSMNSFQKFSLYKVHDLYWLTLIKFFPITQQLFTQFILNIFFMYVMLCYNFNVLDLFSHINYVHKCEFICMCVCVIYGGSFKKKRWFSSLTIVSVRDWSHAGGWPCIAESGPPGS